MSVNTVNKLPSADAPRFNRDIRVLVTHQVFTVDGTDHAFTNSWVNYDTATHNGAGARKHGGRVYLEGAIKGGTSGMPTFTLPSAFRPAKAVELVANDNGAPGYVVVGTDGTVIVTATDTTKFSLEGLSFRTGG